MRVHQYQKCGSNREWQRLRRQTFEQGANSEAEGDCRVASEEQQSGSRGPRGVATTFKDLPPGGTTMRDSVRGSTRSSGFISGIPPGLQFFQVALPLEEGNESEKWVVVLIIRVAFGRIADMAWGVELQVMLPLCMPLKRSPCDKC